MKRVIVGQDQMLERVMVALLAGGHLLIEGVPGLAKTLTIKTVAEVVGGAFKRVQFTPDLVPSDIVGTRIYRADGGGFDTELGPVFCNFLLADEINRAPAKVQSALLEVMQERQVTIGPATYPIPAPFLVLATQNPIEAEGTYPLPEAQVDRFMLKVVVGYPTAEEEALVVQRSLAEPPCLERILSTDMLLDLQRLTADVFVDPKVQRYAVAVVNATRRPRDHKLGEIEPYLSFGASPRGSLNLVHAAQALAVLRGREYVLTQDVHNVAKDVLRHRLVLSYQAMVEEVSADDILDRILKVVPWPRLEQAADKSA
ncbi:MAG: MoxR family ATPase [Chloroflexi bacterium]|nr:MoxR family ATPase [Chloroflexota bacterium]